MDNPVPELITKEIAGGSMVSLGSTLVLGSVLRKIIPVPVIPELASGIIVGFANPIPRHRISSLSGSAIATAILLASKSEADSKAIEKDDYTLKTITWPKEKTVPVKTPSQSYDIVPITPQVTPPSTQQMPKTTLQQEEAIQQEEIDEETDEEESESYLDEPLESYLDEPLFKGDIPNYKPTSVVQILFLKYGASIRINPPNPFDFMSITFGNYDEKIDAFLRSFHYIHPPDDSPTNVAKYIKIAIKVIATNNLIKSLGTEVHLLVTDPIAPEFESLINEIIKKYGKYDWLRVFYG